MARLVRCRGEPGSGPYLEIQASAGQAHKIQLRLFVFVWFPFRPIVSFPASRMRALSSGAAGTRNGACASLARLERSSPTFLFGLPTGEILHRSGQASRDAQATNHGKKRKMLYQLMLGRVDTSYNHVFKTRGLNWTREKY